VSFVQPVEETASFEPPPQAIAAEPKTKSDPKKDFLLRMRAAAAQQEARRVRQVRLPSNRGGRRCAWTALHKRA
jgi:hypothetical protein